MKEPDTKAGSHSPQAPGDGGRIERGFTRATYARIRPPDGYRREWPLTASPTTDAGGVSGTPTYGATDEVLAAALAKLWELDQLVKRSGGEHYWTGRTDNTSRDLSPYWRARLDAA